MARRIRFGWLGPLIVAVGTAVAGFGLWVMLKNRPTAGVVLDQIQLDAKAKVLVRGEAGGDRSFIELHVDGDLKWQALVPPYAGRAGVPGIAWSDKVLSVRVIRDNRAEVFALAMHDASKLGGIHLTPDKGPVLRDAPGPLTLTDHVRSYELVSGQGWNRIVAIGLDLGKIIWKRELAIAPIETAGIEDGFVWVQQAGAKRWFNVFSGSEDRSVDKIGPPPQTGVPPAWPTTSDFDKPL
ncbi:MAG: hypothetical protein H0T42_31480 [Deltaproteobacteria bacterium]|nr:hypothetical protein [Deltaproteobacteria bacterium]